MLEVVTFGNNVGGVKEVDDGMIGNDLDEMGKVEGVENKNVGKNESDEETRENGKRNDGVPSIPPLHPGKFDMELMRESVANWIMRHEHPFTNLEKKSVLSFINIPPPRRGRWISDAIFGCMKEWGIEKKVFTITVDNASSNDSAIRYMKDTLQRSRCLGSFSKEIEKGSCPVSIERFWDMKWLNILNVISNLKCPGHVFYLQLIYKLWKVMNDN
nr:zinc finger BED domain-containing protein RICESLEEPER 2-like [Ipomoea batatas]GMD93543.1 zinc finger BED domain-containing protein RICESLEEPER 2-like [Ipomoea batatas]